MRLRPSWLTFAPHSNIGVLQTTVAEMITVKEHQRRSYLIGEGEV